MKPKIFIFDIETSPITAYTWSLWTEARSYDNVISDWSMLSWAGKWLGDDEVYWDVNSYRDPLDDTKILQSLHSFMDEADIIVAHNGNKFDIKKMNARFLLNGMKPPSPYRKIDTLLEARKYFALTSNRLDALGEMLGLGRKKETGGFKLWTRCLSGDKAAFEEMVEYNIQDVCLLEDVYLTLRPWMQNHPNVGVFNADNEVPRPHCPKCGSQAVEYRGYATTQAGKYRRYQCQSCGGWGRERVSVLTKTQREGLTNNIQ